LHSVDLEGATLGDVPRELLGRDCLQNLRAHFQDLHPGAEEITRVKFMILGNGRIGKTQICHRLRGEDYNLDEGSTHGVRISAAELPPTVPDGRATPLKIWDFGGQDIYLGTHALFLKTRALFPVVWTPEAETREEYEHGGLTFRNYPLDYWTQYVAQMAGTDSPLVLIQNQVDGPSDRPRRAPAAPDLLDRFAWCREVAYSAKTRNGHPSLIDALQQAAAYLRESQGPVRVGSGRAEVQRRLEAIQQEAQAAREAGRPDPEQGWITRAHFADICDEVGNVSSPDHLLDYLHQIGTVFYRQDFFHDRIIIDQQWALDAIYAVFERGSGVYKYLRDVRRGRFTRYELAAHLWDRLGHEEAEQRLFLSMMQSCGICFHLRGDEADKEPEYVAPDLLPERDRVEKTFTVMWDEEAETAEAAFTYDVLPPGLLRHLMSHFGQKAGLRADYWADGFQFYDAAREARARIEQVHQEGEGTRSWAGRIEIRTQARAPGRGDADGLLAQLVKLVDKVQERLGVTTATFDMPQRGIVDRLIRPGQLRHDQRLADAVRRRETIQAAREHEREGSGGTQRDGMEGLSPDYEPQGHAYYVSYAWGGNATKEDRRREAVVDALCEKAERQGIQIIRDKDFMSQGDSITRFMQQIAEGQRVYVVLSQKYLRSPFCMFELHEIYRECSRRDNKLGRRDDEFRRCVRVITLPNTDIFDPFDRIAHARRWRDERDRLAALIRDCGVDVTGEDATRRVRLMTRFTNDTADILALVADTLNPTSVADIEYVAF